MAKSTGAPPRSVPKKGRSLAAIAGFLAAGVLLLVAGAFGVFHFARSWFAPQRDDLIVHTVGYEDLELTVMEKGNLEAAENTDIICRVKAGGRGSNFATTIKWIAEPGTRVMSNRPEHLRKNVRGDWVWPHTYHSDVPFHRRGKPMTSVERDGDKEMGIASKAALFEQIKVWSDLVVELDAAGLEDQERTQQIAVGTAESALIKAEGDLKSARSQNEIDLAKAEALRDVAKLAMQGYGDEESGGEYSALVADLAGRLKQAEDQAAYSKRMERKGYVSNTVAEADELARRKLFNDLNVLTKFTRQTKKTQLKSDHDVAVLGVGQVKIQNAAREETAKKERDTKKKILDQELAKLNDLREQIAHCQLYAPADGMIVYYESEQERRGFGSQQSTIAQGEQVREGQRLIRIPSLDQMLVNTKVHEALVSRVKQGLSVDIQVEAFPDQILQGTVRSVGTIAMPPEWRSSDVKMYLTTVTIDGAIPGLKPGMTAECTIHIDAKKHVLTVPVQAIVGGAELGANRKVYVKRPEGGWEERDIVIGLNNEKMAEVKSGLQEGDLVILNPKVLLGDSAKTRQPGEFENKYRTNNGEKTQPVNAAPTGETGEQRGPGAGTNGDKFKMNPADFKKKMDEDPEFRKKMMERGFDPSKLDPSKFKGKSGRKQE